MVLTSGICVFVHYSRRLTQTASIKVTLGLLLQLKQHTNSIELVVQAKQVKQNPTASMKFSVRFAPIIVVSRFTLLATSIG